MGKEGDLWDDSALINAFDNAMSSYKKMHGMKSHVSLNEEGNASSGGVVASASAFIDENHGAINQACDMSNSRLNTVTESEGTNNLATVKENPCVDSFGVEPHTQNAEDYNQLLSQYYELEEKRQRILEKLHQFGGYNYQYPAEGSNSGLQWATGDHSHPANQASASPLISSCCPYACHCSLAPCPAFPTCGFDGTTIGKTCNNFSAALDHGKPFFTDDDIHKTAMGAAERAISSLKTETTLNSGPEGRDKNKFSIGETGERTNSETDLGAVLNAWYSAGFYTARYLTEQSKK